MQNAFKLQPQYRVQLLEGQFPVVNVLLGRHFQNEIGQTVASLSVC